MIRDGADLAAEAWALSQSPQGRPEAACKYMEARRLINEVFPNVNGRGYLNMTQAEWDNIEAFHNTLPGPFPALVTWMNDTVTQVYPIKSEVSL